MNAGSSRRLISCTVVGLFVAAAVASAQAPTALRVKLGLWEMTTTAQMSGALPFDTSKMTPEQRAKVEAAMKGMMQNAMAPHTIKSCLTQEKLDKTLFEDNKECTPTMVTNTATAYSFKVVCTGKHPSTGEWQFVALTPESVKGTGHMTMENGTTVTSNMTGKWLAADCGNVK
ncbi:MAG: DUF3617 domain-containing protein [Betaproteobacteria bacterium]